LIFECRGDVSAKQAGGSGDDGSHGQWDFSSFGIFLWRMLSTSRGANRLTR
jgi:hypothetical protein